MQRWFPCTLTSVWLATGLLGALAIGTIARAQLPEGDVRTILLEAATPIELRSRLIERARSIEASDRAGAGEAWSLAAQSYERGGERDSAIACYRKANEARSAHEDRLRLADMLLARRADGDLPAAVATLAPGRVQAAVEERSLVPLYDGRIAWAEYLSGHADSAVASFTPHEQTLGILPEWQYRIGVAHLAGGDLRKAYQMLLPLAIASRTEDREVMKALGSVGEKMGIGTRINQEIDRVLTMRDRSEGAVIRALGATGMRFTADDRFKLGGVLVRATGTARAGSAVVLVAPGDSLPLYDSLSVHLRRAGYATVLLDVRGSGWSVDEPVPLPDTWRGREQRLSTLVARDVRTAVRALAGAVSVDTSRIVLVAVGPTAPIAAEAAANDSRITALVFVSPSAPPVEAGPMRARLRGRHLPAFFQLGLEDQLLSVQNDAFVRAGDERASRQVETRAAARGVVQFRRDPSAGPRLIQWLKDNGSKPRKAAAIPPARRRRG